MPTAAAPRPELFFGLSNDLLCIAGMDGYFKQVNPAWERTLGYAAADLCARPYLDFVHPDDRAATAAVAANLASGHEVSAFENRLRRSDGAYCWLLWSANARLDEQLIYAVARDVTDLKRAEAAGQRWAAHLEILRGIDRGILTAQPAEDIAAGALRALRSLVGCQRASAALFDFQASQAVILAVDADGPTQLAVGARPPVEAFSSLPALLAGEMQLIPDITALPAMSATDRQLLAEGVRARLSLPLRVEGELIGALNLGASDAGAFPAEQVVIAQSVADQVAVAVRQVQLREATRQRLEELAGLHEIASSLSFATDVRQTFGRLAERVARLLNAAHCVVVLREPDGVWRAQAPGYGLSEAEIGELHWRPDPDMRPLLPYESTPQVVAVEELPGRLGDLARRLGVERVMFGPMWIGDRLIGHVLVTNRPGGFGPGEARLLGVFAGQAAVVIHNARLFEQLEQQAHQTTALLESAEAISSPLEFEAALRVTADQARALLDGSGCRIHLLEPDGETLRCVIAQDPYAEDLLALRLKVGQGLVGAVAQSRQPLSTTAPHPDAVRLPSVPPTLRGCLALAPMLAQPGDRLLGVMTVWRQGTDRPFRTAEERLLAAFATHAALAIERAQLYEAERRARAQLQALSHRLVDVQETERRALARELHDEVGQTLTGLKLLLIAARGQAPEASAPRLAEALHLVNGLMTRVHDLSLDLRPAMLDDLGLPAALTWLFERYTHQTGVRVAGAFTRLDGRLPPEVETTTYRIVQEALTNVARHAQVDSVRVRLMVDADALRLQVQDEGCGFDLPAVLASSGRAGLAGMHERAALLGGILQIDSQPGGGALVMAVLPLNGPVRLHAHLHSAG